MSNFNMDKIVKDLSVLSINKSFKITDKERENYKRQSNKAHFKTPEEECQWANIERKICSKCKVNKFLINFKGNTSGTDAFDKNGYRLRRPECSECSKQQYISTKNAKKIASTNGISHSAPDGTLCAICNKPPTKNNGLVFDHCHKKNIFRGYCCNSCNRSIGVFGDDINGMIKGINYLLKTSPQKIQQNDEGFLFIANINV